MKKRIFSLLLALCLVAGVLPTVAYAYDNSGTIDSGTFDEEVNNYGTINGGTFNKTVTNTYIATINEGTFNDTVSNTGTIRNGTFNGDVVNNMKGVITGGTFYGTVSGRGLIRDSAKVTVTFDSDNGNAVQEEKVLKGQKVSAPTNPTKEDCTFVGWYNGDDPYDFSTPVTENITLTAKWTASRIELTKDILESTYKVESFGGYRYVLPSGHYYLGEDISVDIRIDIGDHGTPANVVIDLNGHELKKDNNGALLCPDYSGTLTLTDNSSTKTGKVINTSGDTIVIYQNSKLNAKGGTVEGNVYLSSDNAVIDNTDPSNVTVFRDGQIYGLSSSAAINGGIFYSTVADYDGQITGGTFYGTVSGGSIADSAKVTVTFNSTGGSTVDEQKVLRGQKATNPTVPTKANYSFNGWYQGNTAFDFANTPVIENITLTAKWSENPDIIFNTTPQPYTYAITSESAKNGTVTVAPKTAVKGATVTITVEPDKGYTLETLTVTDASGNEIELTNKGDGKYTFTMPASKVTVTATFMEDNSMLNFFVDVFPGDYYYDAVLWAAKNGITGGVDDIHFAPNATCTRAQIVTFLWRAAKCPEPETMTSFADVPADSYYAKAVAWALENGITTGTGGGTTFSPNATCTRAQAMTFIYRSEQARGGGMEGDWMFRNPFSDVDLENYYGEAVMWAVANGVTDGTTATTFSPNATCTRAQIVTFLYRCLGE